MQVLEILTEARALIADPKHWTTRAWNRSRDGVERYCAIGAVRQVTDFGKNYSSARGALEDSAMALFHNDAISVNDGFRGNLGTVVPKSRLARHKAVLRVYDHAIAMLTPAQETAPLD